MFENTSNVVPIESLLAWPLLILLMLWMDRRHRGLPLFLNYAYIANLAVIHYPGAFAHALPWKPFLESGDTIAGMELTTIALACFVLGTVVVPAPRDLPAIVRNQAVKSAAGLSMGKKFAQYMLVGGVIAWIAEMTPLHGLPSVTSLIAAGKQLLIGGICLNCWLASTEKDYVRLNRWLATAVALPVYTVVSSGFLGFGLMFLLTVLIFAGNFYRPRLVLVSAGGAAIYGGLSFFVAYLAARTSLRQAVWGGSDIGSRFDKFLTIFSNLKLFDPMDPMHLFALDLRLNQNYLVGAAVHYVPDFKPYALGETIYMALIAVVPRAIWPDKPVQAGSMGLMNEYTGLYFTDGTSVGMGQVVEFYVNYGTLGVVVGFFLLGMLIRMFDMRVGEAMLKSDWPRFVLWFLVGTAVLQPGGMLLELTSSMAGAAFLGVFLSRIVNVQSARSSRSV